MLLKVKFSNKLFKTTGDSTSGWLAFLIVLIRPKKTFFAVMNSMPIEIALDPGGTGEEVAGKK